VMTGRPLNRAEHRAEQGRHTCLMQPPPQIGSAFLIWLDASKDGVNELFPFLIDVRSTCMLTR